RRQSAIQESQRVSGCLKDPTTPFEPLVLERHGAVRGIPDEATRFPIRAGVGVLWRFARLDDDCATDSRGDGAGILDPASRDLLLPGLVAARCDPGDQAAVTLHDGAVHGWCQAA